MSLALSWLPPILLLAIALACLHSIHMTWEHYSRMSLIRTPQLASMQVVPGKQQEPGETMANMNEVLDRHVKTNRRRQSSPSKVKNIWHKHEKLRALMENAETLVESGTELYERVIATLSEVSKAQPTMAQPRRLVRSPDLKDLAMLMNSIGSDQVPANTNTKERYSAMIEHITPWIFAESNVSFTWDRKYAQGQQGSLRADCMSMAHQDLFNGSFEETPKLIVDLVLFGYDFDLLELRFLETYDIVDMFILYEAPYTLQGICKPLFFRESLLANPDRWKRFLNKIMYISPARSEFIKALNIIHTRDLWDTKAAWIMFDIQHQLPIQILKDSQHPITRMLKRSLDHALIIQSDGDELINANALFHFKHCATVLDPPLYVPCFAFKHNVEWPQRGVGTIKRAYRLISHWTSSGIIQARDSLLGSFMWESGPIIYTLKSAIESGNLNRHGWDPTYRSENTSSGIRYRFSALGIGSAFHLSSLAAPEHQWLKAGGIVEGAGIRASFSAELLSAIRSHAVTPELIASQMSPWCHMDAYAIHISNLSSDPILNAQLKERLLSSVPNALWNNRERYPFLLPGENWPKCSWQCPKGARTASCSWVSPIIGTHYPLNCKCRSD